MAVDDMNDIEAAEALLQLSNSDRLMAANRKAAIPPSADPPVPSNVSNEVRHTDATSSASFHEELVSLPEGIAKLVQDFPISAIRSTQSNALQSTTANLKAPVPYALPSKIPNDPSPSAVTHPRQLFAAPNTAPAASFSIIHERSVGFPQYAVGMKPDQLQQLLAGLVPQSKDYLSNGPRLAREESGNEKTADVQWNAYRSKGTILPLEGVEYDDKEEEAADIRFFKSYFKEYYSGVRGNPKLPEKIHVPETRSDFHDPDVKAPWYPRGSRESALFKAHAEHRARYVQQQARRAAEQSVDLPGERSWNKGVMVARLVRKQPKFAGRMRDWNRRSGLPYVSPEATPGPHISEDYLHAGEDGLLEPCRRIVDTVINDREGMMLVRDAAGAPARDPNNDHNMTPVGSKLEYRANIFNLAKKLYEGTEKLPMPPNPIYDPTSNSFVVNAPILAGEEFDIIENVKDPLEDLMTEALDPPIGIFNDAEVAYYEANLRMKKIAIWKEAGASEAVVEKTLMDFYGHTGAELAEMQMAAREQLVAERKLLPGKPLPKKRKFEPDTSMTASGARKSARLAGQDGCARLCRSD